MRLSTNETSHISLYRGKEGLEQNTPLINRVTMALLPKFTFPEIDRTAESAERAVFIEL